MNYWLFVVPILTSIAGWLSIRLFVKFLFYPSTPIRIFGIAWVGIIPAARLEAIENLALFISIRFPVSDLSEKLINTGNLERIMPIIEEHIDQFLRVKLPIEMPYVGMFIGDKTTNTLKTIFVQELKAIFPEIMSNYIGQLSSVNDIKRLISEKLTAIPIKEFETSFYLHLGRSLEKAALLGGLIGLLIGVLELFIILVVI